MPIPKRWFAVSREIADDPEVWELTDTFGDRALRTWLEVLALLDRTENSWKLSGQWLAGLSRKTRQKPATVQREIDWMISKRWLVAAEQFSNNSTVTLTSPNYFKYHKRREPDSATLGSDQGPTKDREMALSDRTLSDRTLSDRTRNEEKEGKEGEVDARGRGSVSTNGRNADDGLTLIGDELNILEKWPHLRKTT